jgi:predicted ester cyclase
VIRTPLPVEATGAQLLKQVFAVLLEAFPDLHITIEALIAEGTRSWPGTWLPGTQEAEFMGRPATGELVAYNEIFIFRPANDRIAESGGIVERPHILR